MITVSILINGNPLMARSAVNVSDPYCNKDGTCNYKLDTGKIIRHNPNDGAVVLAKKMLDTIKEV